MITMSRKFVYRFATVFAAAGIGHSLAHGADPGIEFFESKIRPLLVAHCYECHAADAKKLGGNLRLDSRAGVAEGGDSGPALEPGQPEKSLLVQAVRYADDAPHMPPTGKLPDQAIAALEAWVKMGAPDPRDAAPPGRAQASADWEAVLAERRNWWSLKPVRKPDLPAPSAAGNAADPIDRFLLARLAENGLEPAEPADRRTLARRLCLTLTGLPPTAEQLAAFDQDCLATASVAGPAGAPASQAAPLAAVERLVDSLLESPHFGERWARHWMDVVRFGETHGNEWNYEVHHAWRYRDYLIRAFNADVPFDQFVREHVAGDLLAAPRWNAREQFDESAIGTAFYRFGEANHDDCIALRPIGFDLADNQIDTLTKAFQATTVACARCHDHKIDAVSMYDYYALLGILRSSRLTSHTIDAPSVNAEGMQRLKELKPAIRAELAVAWREDARQLGRRLLAAQAKRAGAPNAAELAQGLDAARLEKWAAALAEDKAPQEDLFGPWRAIAGADPASFAASWSRTAERYAAEDRARLEFNRTQFVLAADFQTAPPGNWQAAGQGLRDGATRGGDFALHPEGDSVVQAVLPSGCFTHAISDKLNGALRSPVLPAGHKYLSLQVMGRHGAALRLVSNNCQLNYRNYRALTAGDLQWVTFSPPEDGDSLRTYAELTTMFDNPKFPDQLAALGGDGENYRLPWEEAAKNPRSCFGVTRAVWHDGPEPPRAELAHLRSLLAGDAPADLAGLAARYAAAAETAIAAWSEDRASPEEVRWIDGLLRRELLGNALDLSPRLAELAAEYRRVEAELALPRVVPGVSESDPYDQPVFARGDCYRPGEPVPRRYLEALSNSRDAFGVAGSGRLELAERIASPQNPLTARVIVNRVWHHLFGEGLVRTVDDFGHVGELPSHPELLDYLASRFVEEGWSIKRLVRGIALTAAFRRSNQPAEAANERDPENRLLSHYPARRMEAEAIRDAILATAGRLDRTLYGPSIQPYREKANVDRRLFPGPLDGHGRRSIYIKNNLMEGPKFLATFNFPGGKTAQGRRDVTNVPAQALALLNDPFVWQQAEIWGGQLVTRPDEPITARIDAMFETALGRLPSPDERRRFERAVLGLAELHQAPASDLARRQAVWRDLAHVFFNLREFIYIP